MVGLFSYQIYNMKLNTICEQNEDLVGPIQLFVGADNKPRIPGYMSDNALQATLYASVKSSSHVFTGRISLYNWDSVRSSLNIVERLWYLDHAYGKDSEIFQRILQIKPGIYDSAVGEALVTIPIPLQELRGMDLLHVIVSTYKNAGGESDITPDTIHAMLRKDSVRDLFGDAYESFVAWLNDLGYEI